jgi:hypothetical protein
MGNKVKKAKLKLDRRLKLYEELSRKLGSKWSNANKKPGSLKYS